MILIISYEGDPHAVVVKEKLGAMREEVLLLDYAEYPANWQISASLDRDGKTEITFELPDRKFLGSAVRSVWYRRAKDPGARLRYQSSALAGYIQREAKTFLRSLPHLLKAFWVSHPEAIERASLKPLQLSVASLLGFRIPATMVGNAPAGITSLLGKTYGADIVTKAVDMPYVAIDSAVQSQNLILYTSRLSATELVANVERTRNCPIIVQELIEKECDVRVTVVGTQVFAAAIVRETDDGRVDWRHYDLPNRYERHTLPQEIAQRCVASVKELGLAFGCIDLGYTKSGEYVFFEINPSGQWLPSEIFAGVLISDTLAEMLARGST